MMDLSVLDIAKCREDRESQLSDDDGDSTPSTGTRIPWDMVEHIRYIEPREPPSLEPNQPYIFSKIHTSQTSSITLLLLLLLLLLLKSDFTIQTTQAAFGSITRAERAKKKERAKKQIK